MKIIYLDQNHWICLSGATNGRSSGSVSSSFVESLHQARRTGRACFPLSYAHYIETRKVRKPDRRSRLATCMSELSDGRTVAPSAAVIRHEIEMALCRCFSNRVVPEPFEFLGHGLAHAAANRNLDLAPPPWPPGANPVPALLRAAIEGFYRADLERRLLSGVRLTGTELGPLTDLSVERNFKESLEQWRGAASKYPRGELEREICDGNFSDIDDLLREALARYAISLDEFSRRGELPGQAFLDYMPSQRADMHLKMQWAKNANLKPRDSDLVDWSFLGVAISYCDIVVTDNQMADLFSRGFETRATVIAKLDQLPELLA
jgi:hypothetical protein